MWGNNKIVWSKNLKIMSTTAIARACSPKDILDISNYNVATNAGNILGILKILIYLKLIHELGFKESWKMGISPDLIESNGRMWTLCNSEQLIWLVETMYFVKITLKLQKPKLACVISFHFACLKKARLQNIHSTHS